jgi:pimeloyl-ACP methyl ester carboxylesterase
MLRLHTALAAALLCASWGAQAQFTRFFADAGPALSGPPNRNESNLAGSYKSWRIGGGENPALEERWLNADGYIKDEHYAHLVSTNAVAPMFTFRLRQRGQLLSAPGAPEGFLAPMSIERSSAARSVVTKWYLNGTEIAVTTTYMQEQGEFELQLPTRYWKFNAFQYKGPGERPIHTIARANHVTNIRDIANARPLIELPNGNPYNTACTKVGNFDIMSIPERYRELARSGESALLKGTLEDCLVGLRFDGGSPACWFHGIPNYLPTHPTCNGSQLRGYARNFFDTTIDNVSITTRVAPAFIGNHGLDGDSTTWLALFEKLRERGYVAYEKHYYGNPSQIVGATAATFLLQDVLIQTNRPNVVAIGHSFGGVTWATAASMLGAKSPIEMILNYATPLQGSAMAAMINAYQQEIPIDGTDYKITRAAAKLVFSKFLWASNQDTVKSLHPQRLVPWYQGLQLPSRTNLGAQTAYINIAADYWLENKTLGSTRRPGENSFPGAKLFGYFPPATRSAYQMNWDVQGLDIVDTTCEVNYYDDNGYVLVERRRTVPCKRAFLIDNKQTHKGSDLVVPRWSSAPLGGPFEKYAIYGRDHGTVHDLDDGNNNAEPGSDALTIFDGVMHKHFWSKYPRP